jgi:uncharacterized DUF497 family protein
MAHARFEWDPRKDAANRLKHGVSFAEAQEAFFDPFRVVARAMRDTAAPSSASTASAEPEKAS